MAKFKKIITPEEEDKILELFYRTELRKGEVVIDNRDSEIAKELGLNASSVGQFIFNHLEIKFDKLGL